MVLPDGTIEAEEDGGGVPRDALSDFFMTASLLAPNSKFLAFDATLLKEWESVSKIIVFWWRSCGYFPIQLSLSFMEQCIFGKSSASLENAFFEVIAEDETATLKNALSDFPFVGQAL